MRNVYVETEQEVCLNYVDSILSIVPLSKSLYDENDEKADDILISKGEVSDNMIALYTKLSEGRRNLDNYCDGMIDIIDNTLVPLIRSSIQAALTLNDNDVSAVSAIECFVLDYNYIKKSNSRIMRYNIEHDIAIENAYIIDAAQDYWYTVEITPSGIEIQKENAASVTLQNIIDNKLREMLYLCDNLTMFIERHQQYVAETIFSEENLKCLSDIIHGEGDVEDILNFVPNPVAVDNVYKTIMSINSAINAIGVNANIARDLIEEQHQIITETQL